MQIFSGKVLTNGMLNTLVVAVEYTVVHPKYKKQMKRTSKLKVHNTDSTVGVGDFVEIVSCRPVSKGKFFELKRVIEKSKVIKKISPEEEKKEVVVKDVKKSKKETKEVEVPEKPVEVKEATKKKVAKKS